MPSPSKSSLAGKTLVLDARYELEEQLGSGSFGAVYRARDVRAPASAPVYRAVKAIRKPEHPNKGKLGMIRREARLHAAVSAHPNVVTAHGAWEDAEYVYILLDYCSGGDLYDYIDEGEFRGDDARVKSVFVQIVDAVMACHERGVFHRDIKPENIMCSADGNEVYLADFGLATDKERSLRHGAGSAMYMSPECIGEEFEFAPYSTRTSDVWALGVILVQLVAGTAPWKTARIEDTRFWRFLDALDGPCDGAAFWGELGVSQQLGALLNRVFELEPEMRMTAEELREEILEVGTLFATEDEREMNGWRLSEPLDGSLDSDESFLLGGMLNRGREIMDEVKIYQCDAAETEETDELEQHENVLAAAMPKQAINAGVRMHFDAPAIESEPDSDFDDEEMPETVVNVVLPVLDAADELASYGPSDISSGSSSSASAFAAHELHKADVNGLAYVPHAILSVVMPVLEAADILASSDPSGSDDPFDAWKGAKWAGLGAEKATGMRTGPVPVRRAVERMELA